jgi:hypothetical protein
MSENNARIILSFSDKKPEEMIFNFDSPGEVERFRELLVESYKTILAEEKTKIPDISIIPGDAQGRPAGDPCNGLACDDCHIGGCPGNE